MKYIISEICIFLLIYLLVSMPVMAYKAFDIRNSINQKDSTTFENSIFIIAQVTKAQNNHFFINAGIQNGIKDSFGYYFLLRKKTIFSVAEIKWLGRKKARLRIIDGFPLPVKGDALCLLNDKFDPHKNFKTYLDIAEIQFNNFKPNSGMAYLIYAHILSPNSIDPMIMISEIMLKRGFFAETVLFSQKGLNSKYPVEIRSRAYALTGMGFLGCRRYMAAWATFKKSLMLSSSSNYVISLSESGFIMCCQKLNDTRLDKERIIKKALRRLRALSMNYSDLLDSKLPKNWNPYLEFKKIAKNH